MVSTPARQTQRKTTTNTTGVFQTPPQHTSHPAEESSAFSASSSVVSTSSASRRRTKGRNNSSSLPFKTDQAILRLLLSPNRVNKFGPVCNSNPILYGSSDTSFRRQVQNRRRFLLSLQEKHIDEFFDICREYDLVKEVDDSKQSPARSTAALSSTAESNQSPELYDQQSPLPTTTSQHVVPKIHPTSFARH
jgi:hypothetical protein